MAILDPPRICDGRWVRLTSCLETAEKNIKASGGILPRLRKNFATTPEEIHSNTIRHTILKFPPHGSNRLDDRDFSAWRGRPVQPGQQVIKISPGK
jgi:hypothetical protein